MDNFGNRKIVFKALVGSRNYNLNDETSDKDYKYFVLPTFDDLYEGKMFSTSKVGTEVDYDVHDIRKLTELFWKANVNFLEVLYSKELEIIHKTEVLTWVDPVIGLRTYETLTPPELQEIFNMRDSISTMNLPYLYSACKGMYFEKMKRLEKGTEGTRHLVDTYGYDTKQALHAIRVLTFISRFYDYNWDFQKALTFDTQDRKVMLEIKHGKYSLDEFHKFAEAVFEFNFSKLEETYKSKTPDLETKGKLESLIKELVRKNI